MSEINLDGANAWIAFEGAEEDGAFTVDTSDAQMYRLSANGEGTWKISGFALKILKESGYDALVLSLGDSCITIPTESAAEGGQYALLKSKGVGERRMVYEYMLSDDGTNAFTLYADGVPIDAAGIYSVSKEEDDGG